MKDMFFMDLKLFWTDDWRREGKCFKHGGILKESISAKVSKGKDHMTHPLPPNHVSGGASRALSSTSRGSLSHTQHHKHNQEFKAGIYKTKTPTFLTPTAPPGTVNVWHHRVK